MHRVLFADKCKNDFSDPDFLIRTTDKSFGEFKWIDCLLKGKEVQRPDVFFFDKGGKKRNSYRIKWWKEGKLLCREALFEFPQDNDEMMPFIMEGMVNSTKYEHATSEFTNYERAPVFFGHYWLKDDMPVLQSINACCLDFSVAKKGLLAAYRWDGEQELKPEKFYWVGNRERIASADSA